MRQLKDGPEMSGADLDFDPARLAPYLAARLPQCAGPMEAVRIGGGQSNPTYRLRFAAGEVVLRKQPAGALLPSAHAVDREHRVMAALHATDVPVPRMLHLCEDRALIGTLFYVMEALDGRVIHDSSIPGVTPAERAAMFDSMNDVLARLHRVDWQAVGLFAQLRSELEAVPFGQAPDGHHGPRAA